MTILVWVCIALAVEAVTADDSRKLLIGEDPKQETRPKKK